MSKLKTRKTIPTLCVGWGWNGCGFPSVKVLGVSRLSALLLLGSLVVIVAKGRACISFSEAWGFYGESFRGAQWYGTVERVPDVIFHCMTQQVWPHHLQFREADLKVAMTPTSSSSSFQNQWIISFSLFFFFFFFKLNRLRTSEFLKWAYPGRSGEPSPESASQAFLLNATSCRGGFNCLRGLNCIFSLLIIT